MKVQNYAQALYNEQQRRKLAGSFGYGDFGLRNNENTYKGPLNAQLGDADDDLATGKDILATYYSWINGVTGKLLGYYVDISFDDLVNYYQKQNSNFLESLGSAANVADISYVDKQTAMRNLAEQGKGKIPTSWNAFFSALSDTATTLDWTNPQDVVGAEISVATGTATDIASGVQSGGQALIDTGKAAAAVAQEATNYPKLILFTAIGIGAFLIYNNLKKVSG